MKLIEVGELIMRLRNVKNACEILASSFYFVKEPESMRGNWNEVFGNDNPIMLEIGMGKGDFLIGMAALHPDWNFIGIEKYESVLVRGVQKLDELELKNVRVINVDAIKISDYFSKEIDTIYLNFSDPWPKKRHYKRRLTYKDFLIEYDKTFKENPKIEMKTDNDSLFESTLVNLNNYGYLFDEVILDLWSTEKPNIKTEYEIKFANKGFKIKYLRVHKNK